MTELQQARADWIKAQERILELEIDKHRLIVANAELQMNLCGALAAADVLAHQYIFTPFHERYWQARGGHDACTVCEPAEAAICACGEPKDPKADCCLNCYALHDSEEATSTREVGT